MILNRAITSEAAAVAAASEMIAADAGRGRMRLPVTIWPRKPHVRSHAVVTACKLMLTLITEAFSRRATESAEFCYADGIIWYNGIVFLRTLIILEVYKAGDCLIRAEAKL